MGQRFGFGQHSSSDSHAKLGLACAAVKFESLLGQEPIVLTAAFDTSNRMVQVSSEDTKYRTSKAAGIGCAAAMDVLSSAYGEGKVHAYTSPPDGTSLTAIKWTTRATVVELTCFNNVFKDDGTVSVILTYGPWNLAASKVR
jgi:hypothetical protein